MIVGVTLPAGDTEDANNIIGTLIAQANQAAKAGVRSVWFSQLLDHDALMLAALAGREVPGISVGTSVVPLYPRPPLLLASLVQTAQAATGGRFRLGVGLGAKDILEPAYGVPYPPPMRHLRETLTVLRPMLAGEQVHYQGDTVRQAPSLPIRVAGAQPAPPVYVAALGPRALRAAGELADGTMPFLAGPKTLAEFIVPTVTEAAERAERPKPKVVAAVPCVVTTDVDSARTVTDEQLAYYDAIPSYAKLVAREGLRSARELLVIGNEVTVARQLMRYFDAGADEVVLTSTGVHGGRDRMRTWRLAGQLTQASLET